MNHREAGGVSDLDVVRAFIEAGGYEVVRMSDGELSSVPMDKSVALAALARLLERQQQETEALREALRESRVLALRTRDKNIGPLSEQAQTLLGLINAALGDLPSFDEVAAALALAADLERQQQETRVWTCAWCNHGNAHDGVICERCSRYGQPSGRDVVCDAGQQASGEAE